MAKIKGKKESAEKKHALWFEPAEQMETLLKAEEDIHMIMRDFWKKPFEFGAGETLPRRMGAIPVGLSETDKELIARAELPGFSKEEIRLKVTENTIEISAKKKRQTVQKEKAFFRRERSFGAMKRVMSLPYVVKPDESRAKFENGVLAIIMPKAEPKKIKEIRPE